MPLVLELEEEDALVESYERPVAYPEDQALEYLECLELLGETPDSGEVWESDMEAFGMHVHAG